MYKKISKTIILVVFLAFFGIMKVNAVDETICTYTYDSKGSSASKPDSATQTQLVTVMETGSIYIEDKKGSYYNEMIRNWNTTKGGFNGSEYYQKTSNCPPYFLVDDDVGRDPVYFADDDTLDGVKDVIDKNDWVLFKLTAQSKPPQESKTNDSKSCKPKKSDKNYSDPNVVPQEPLESDFSTYSCGDKKIMTGIPVKIPKFTKFIYNFIQFLVPLLLIILGSIDLIKSVAGGKEDEIKKGQQIFIKRLVAGALVFFALSIVKLLVSVVFKDSADIIKCVNCFINGGESCTPENEVDGYTYSHISNSNVDECEEG